MHFETLLLLQSVFLALINFLFLQRVLKGEGKSKVTWWFSKASWKAADRGWPTWISWVDHTCRRSWSRRPWSWRREFFSDRWDLLACTISTQDSQTNYWGRPYSNNTCDILSFRKHCNPYTTYNGRYWKLLNSL